MGLARVDLVQANYLGWRLLSGLGKDSGLFTLWWSIDSGACRLQTPV
jgi:hypothetical protein